MKGKMGHRIGEASKRAVAVSLEPEASFV